MLIFLSQYIYLTGSLIFGLFWIIIFLKTRRWQKILIMSCLFGISAVLIGQFYALHDYWNPVYIFPTLPLEDFLYGFFFGGSLSSVYEFFSPVKTRRIVKPRISLILFGLTVTIASFVILVNVFNFNSIVAHIVPPLLVGLVIIRIHKSLLIPTVISSFIAVVMTFLVFQALLMLDSQIIEKIWLIENLSGIFLLRIPIEEYLFAAALGFGASFFYEVTRGHIPEW